MQDVSFLSQVFNRADIVYCMEAIDRRVLSDPNIDIVALVTQIGKNYKQAIENAGIKRVVLLSSIGANLHKGNGILIFHYNVENLLNKLPDDVSIKVMRPAGFYTNLLRSLQTIKEKGAFVSNYGGDTKEPWVSPLDIAAAIAEEMELPFNGRTVRYIASEEVSPNEIAKVIGEAIGMPELKWSLISDDELLTSMTASGMNTQIAKGFVDMLSAQGDGSLYEDY